MIRDPFTYLHDATKKFGDVVRIPVPMYDFVIVNHPDLVKQIFHDRSGTWGMPTYPQFLRNKTGIGLPGLEGAEYTERRGLYTSMFGKRYLATLADEFVDEMTSRLDVWDRFAASGQEIDLEHEIGMILLPAFLRNMFSITPSDEELAVYDRDLREILASAASATWTRRPPNILPIPGVQNFPGALFRTIKNVAGILDQRKASSNPRKDLLQSIVDARLKDGSPLDRKDMIFDSIGIIVAGYDTVTAVLSWMFSLLPTNPSAQQRLYDEVDALGGATPTADHLPELSWAKQCFDEAQRLQGHPFNPRMAKVDGDLAGFHIPKNTMVGACMTALHRDPRWWTNPETFDPTHFDKDQVTTRPNTAFIPFGTGTHQCVGMAMAYQNGQLLAALILQRYRIHLRPGWTPRHQATQSVTIKGGVPATITRR
ncbi:hypothetical protein BI330_23220 [Mycobacterium sp. CBMA 623]|nr:hypothetical protein [Mycobacteroides sp. CBMA 326]